MTHASWLMAHASCLWPTPGVLLCVEAEKASRVLQGLCEPTPAWSFDNQTQQQPMSMTIMRCHAEKHDMVQHPAHSTRVDAHAGSAAGATSLAAIGLVPGEVFAASNYPCTYLLPQYSIVSHCQHALAALYGVCGWGI
ncbi:hypothetical protein COO60DRAFT_323293 [Scenedesmus sp. NREL 46B-D3]|nr:hypothetical protein COO60DRAFT_323293 [Scenedesmus sp. NREL 46B-D3]